MPLAGALISLCRWGAGERDPPMQIQYPPSRAGSVANLKTETLPFVSPTLFRAGDVDAAGSWPPCQAAGDATSTIPPCRDSTRRRSLLATLAAPTDTAPGMATGHVLCGLARFREWRMARLSGTHWRPAPQPTQQVGGAAPLVSPKRCAGTLPAKLLGERCQRGAWSAGPGVPGIGPGAGQGAGHSRKADRDHSSDAGKSCRRSRNSRSPGHSSAHSHKAGNSRNRSRTRCYSRHSRRRSSRLGRRRAAGPNRRRAAGRSGGPPSRSLPVPQFRMDRS
jgi:hypothetical protein